MADDELDELDEGAEEDFDEEEDEEGAPRRGGKRKLIVIIGLVLLLVIGGVAAAYFTGILDPVIALLTGGSSKTEDGDVVSGEAVFLDLPELLVNLNTGGRKSTFLKIRVSLELQNETDIPRIERLMPRIIDNFQVYLRELRVDDLKGSAGMYRLREELLARVATAAAPAQVNDVLFKEMLVQ